MKYLYLHYRCLPDDAVKYCISACYFSILWGQNHLMELTDSGARGEDECKQLKDHLHTFMTSMKVFVSGVTSEGIETVIKRMIIRVQNFDYCFTFY